MNEAHSATHYLSVLPEGCGKLPAEHLVLEKVFTVKLSAFKNVRRLYQKQQQENPHVCPNESLLRRSGQWEKRRWSMRMSYSNREAVSGEEKRMEDSSGSCSHPAAEVIRPW